MAVNVNLPLPVLSEHTFVGLSLGVILTVGAGLTVAVTAVRALVPQALDAAT